MQDLRKMVIYNWMSKENLETLIAKKFPLDEIYLGSLETESLKRLPVFVEANPLLKDIAIVENMKGLPSETETLPVINGLVEVSVRHKQFRKASIILHER